MGMPTSRTPFRNLGPAVLAALGIFLAGRAAQSHDVITSTVTFNREVRAIFQARCISCHRPDGPAFSLLTYQDARPWAKAIEEEVLRRKMPPWGAVPGFGQFANDPSLTMTEMQQIAEWAEGGAPEGDVAEANAVDATAGSAAVNETPPAVPSPAASPKSFTTVNEITGTPALDRAIRVDAVRVTRAPEKSSFRIVAELPGGETVPLLWIDDSAASAQQVYQYRSTVALPAKSVIRGLPDGAAIELLTTR